MPTEEHNTGTYNVLGQIKMGYNYTLEYHAFFETHNTSEQIKIKLATIMYFF